MYQHEELIDTRSTLIITKDLGGYEQPSAKVGR
jgi:hypothetical protein